MNLENIYKKMKQKINNSTSPQLKKLHFNINSYNIKGIKSYDEFLKQYSSKNTGKFNGKYRIIREKLNNLKGILNIKYSNNPDPISFLLYLYYKEQISIEDISDRLSLLGIQYPKSSLAHLFKTILDLDLRDRLENTDSKNKKDIEKGKNSLLNKAKNGETQIAIGKILESNKGQNIGFKINEYNTKKNKLLKITYLFYKFSFIKNENKNEVLSLINKLYNGGLGAHRITNVFKIIINKYIIQNNKLKISEFQIDPKFIWENLPNKKTI